VFHGKYGEDGQITAFLQTLGCHVAYSPFEVHALCIDKYLTNLTLAPIGIYIPASYLLKKDNTSKDCNIPYPRIIKPNTGWSSIATHKVHTQGEYDTAVTTITDDDILVQSCIEWREFTVWVYRDQSGYHTLPIIEIRTLSWDFFDYTEKYETDGSNEVFMTWEDELQKILSDESIRICEYIGTKWIVRIDYRYDGENIYFLEVNTIPGFTEASLVPKMWKQAGKTEKEFVEMLIG
jgi:D-alanine-D-alanine ligase